MNYKIIYADPAWSFKNKRTGGSMTSGSEAQYKRVMTVDEMVKLPINKIAHPEGSVLFCWWVGSQPAAALALVHAWGYQLKTMTGLTWFKRTKNNKPFFGMGFWTRQNSENCLIAVRGKGYPRPVNHSVRSSFEAVNQGHSIKPPEAREKIVKLMGDLPRCELFARQRVAGWDCWGNEIEGGSTPYLRQVLG